MNGGLRVTQPARRPGVLARVLETPALMDAVQALPSPILHRLVQEVGLEDAAELVALASPAQLAGVFDEALWRAERAGEDPRFDGERLGVWLEVLLEAGEGFAARTLAEISPDLVTLVLCRRALVLDLATLTEGRVVARPTTESEDDGLEHALDARPSQEMAGYLVVARAEEGFDALVGVLLALDELDHAACVRLLERAAAVSSAFVEDHGGLVAILSSEETLEADVAGDRADRRAAAGHVAPSDAAAFFRLARRAAPDPLGEGAPPARDPITRAYFRELAPMTMVSSVDRSSENEAVLRLRALVGSTGAPRVPVDALRAALDTLAGRDPGAADARREELSYVVNLVLSGCALGAEGEPPRPADAVRIASAVTLLGARTRAAEGLTRAASLDKKLVDVLVRETADRLFRLGLHRLHHEIALVVAAGIARRAERGLSVDPSLRGIVALARKAREDGEPWILRRVLHRLDIASGSAAGALVSGLLGPLPLLPAAPAVTGDRSPPSQLLLDGRRLLASSREIARALALVAPLLA